MLQEFLNAVKQQVANHSIYVWGGSGSLCKSVSEHWIRDKEARNNGGSHADDAVKAWKAVMESQYKDVARCFDCSGLVSWCLIQAKALDKRRDCDGLYSLCETTTELRDGTLLFRVNKDDPNDETHVGVYIGGKQYHAKGRTDGCVAEPYKKSYWAKAAWFKKLPYEEEPQPWPEPVTPTTPSPSGNYVEVIGGSVFVRSGYNSTAKILFTAHRGNKFTYLGTAPTGWYQIETAQGVAYISNLSHLTKLYADSQIETEPDQVTPSESAYVLVVGGSVNVRTKGDAGGAIVGVAHRGDQLPYIGTAESGWYNIKYANKSCYISNKPHLTILKEK